MNPWHHPSLAPDNVPVLAIANGLPVIAIHRNDKPAWGVKAQGWCYQGASASRHKPNRGVTHWTEIPPTQWKNTKERSEAPVSTC